MKHYIIKKKNRITRRIARFIIEYGSALIIGVILYQFARPYAVAIRGNEMYGGEIFAFGMPFYWGMIKCVLADCRFVKDIRRSIRGDNA